MRHAQRAPLRHPPARLPYLARDEVTFADREDHQAIVAAAAPPRRRHHLTIPPCHHVAKTKAHHSCHLDLRHKGYNRATRLPDDNIDVGHNGSSHPVVFASVWIDKSFPFTLCRSSVSRLADIRRASGPSTSSFSLYFAPSLPSCRILSENRLFVETLVLGPAFLPLPNSSLLHESLPHLICISSLFLLPPTAPFFPSSPPPVPLSRSSHGRRATNLHSNAPSLLPPAASRPITLNCGPAEVMTSPLHRPPSPPVTLLPPQCTTHPSLPHQCTTHTPPLPPLRPPFPPPPMHHHPPPNQCAPPHLSLPTSAPPPLLTQCAPTGVPPHSPPPVHHPPPSPPVHHPPPSPPVHHHPSLTPPPHTPPRTTAPSRMPLCT
ncbi:hypothetical protein C7M84_006263 [Penaeus vannamei]|uniref:Uncharacterized protein n=1 Tax=Penaeus vannamei TaxID=6689 RepID=A0A423TFE2_PENVA|nr:hypothetical protein C7M84_006263 [Penaeus vannamei]